MTTITLDWTVFMLLTSSCQPRYFCLNDAILPQYMLLQVTYRQMKYLTFTGIQPKKFLRKCKVFQKLTRSTPKPESQTVRIILCAKQKQIYPILLYTIRFSSYIAD